MGRRSCYRCGESMVTPRQAQVGELIARGMSNQAIAEVLGLKLKTVERNVNDLISNLDLRDDFRIAPRVKIALQFHEAGGTGGRSCA